jgi:uncharacterized protein (DUF983 family)
MALTLVPSTQQYLHRVIVIVIVGVVIVNVVMIKKNTEGWPVGSHLEL